MQQKGSVAIGTIPVFLLRSAEILKVVLIFQQGGGGGWSFNFEINLDPTLGSGSTSFQCSFFMCFSVPLTDSDPVLPFQREGKKILNVKNRRIR
jgi:hypothetical protein